eukprot:7381215-Alexandrium_andersonii.AAC.1
MLAKAARTRRESTPLHSSIGPRQNDGELELGEGAATPWMPAGLLLPSSSWAAYESSLRCNTVELRQ